MSSRTLLSLFVLLFAAVAGVFLWWLPKREEQARPVPVAAWVGVELAESGTAVVGRREIEAGSAFRLHAILEAEDPAGGTVWYTEASRVELPDGRTAEGDSVRPWDQPLSVNSVWFTLEGNVPFLPLSEDATLERFGLQEFSRPEWGRGWTVSGSLSPHSAGQVEGFTAAREFGTQRYHVWVEVSEEARTIVPDLRLKSWGADEVVVRAGEFPSVVATLPGAAGKPSSVFGLTQIEPRADSNDAVLQRLEELTRSEIAFTRLGLLRSSLEERGLKYDDLDWKLVDLSAGLSFSEFDAGDLLRVGARWVFLYRDEGTAGVLDSSDLCLDFDSGAVVRPISEVFQAAEGGGDIEWAKL